MDDECLRCGSVGGYGCYECTPEEDTPTPDALSIAEASDDLIAERDALAVEVARLQALMEARDAYDRGEPSNLPHSGKNPSELVE